MVGRFVTRVLVEGGDYGGSEGVIGESERLIGEILGIVMNETH